MIEFKCQDCGHRIVVRDDISGKEVKCQKCGIENVVPSVYFNNEGSNAETASEDTSKKEEEAKAESVEPDQLTEEQPSTGPSQQIEKKESPNLNIPFKYIISIAVVVLFFICITLLFLLNKAQTKEAIRNVELANRQTIELTANQSKI
ncbi:MAG: TFIIB-type zinc ribbon-containing protein [Planctomycetota bacterium]|jgi:DNA-directed RNA polymerase subunit M/transcription elongation factor TFIIS